MDLWCHVKCCATKGGSLVKETLRQPEIAHLYVAFLVEEDVVRLQVPAPCKSRQTASTAVELVELGSPPMTYLSLVQVADGQRDACSVVLDNVVHVVKRLSLINFFEVPPQGWLQDKVHELRVKMRSMQPCDERRIRHVQKHLLRRQLFLDVQVGCEAPADALHGKPLRSDFVLPDFHRGEASSCEETYVFQARQGRGA